MIKKDEYGIQFSILVPVYYSIDGANILYDVEEMIKTLEEKIGALPQRITKKGKRNAK